MCWCQPTMRTPCCGKSSCHDAAIAAGVMKPGETCSLCHPPPPACAHGNVGFCGQCTLDRKERELETERSERVAAAARVAELHTQVELLKVELEALRASARLPPIEALARLESAAMIGGAVAGQIRLDAETVREALARLEDLDS